MKTAEAQVLIAGGAPLQALAAAATAEERGDSWGAVDDLRESASKAAGTGDTLSAAMLDGRASQMAARLRGES